MTDLQKYMGELGAQAKAASATLRLASEAQRNDALSAMATEIRAREADILSANAADMTAADSKGLSAAMLDRLKLDADRVAGIAKGLDDIAALPDPVGAVEKSWTQPNGLIFHKVRVPIGVIAMIYESRPNVTADAGGLCVKSGNACVLRGGSESARSNAAIHAALQAGLTQAGLPETSINLVNTTDRAAVGEMLRGLNETIDIIIPRGGKGLVARVQEDARVPVLAHLEGLNHSYVHTDANMKMALQLIENAKLRRTGVCGSTETLLVDYLIADSFLPLLKGQIGENCELRGDTRAQKVLPGITPATDADFATEHLAAILNIAVVDGLDDALAHIAKYGSGHTDAIITEDAAAAQTFLDSVDSAIVLHNASTQYADGGEFGFGAEIGIATGRLHARGPVGAEHLTTYKYQVRGTGQARP
ncbi:glutamate-5-semialdehyde dehydrogenase [Litorimonas sp. WD9-15]|uniref:glutamate-5-semialdehyde dehydrogenase n=1 Tax=Litorimonas sp. WD9-15 TaxID=3418716 RepID=UPI003D0024E5